MVRRVFVPPPRRAAELPHASLRPNFGPWTQSVPPSRGTLPPPASGGALPRRSVPPPGPAPEGLPVASCAQLLDRLGGPDDATFVASWIEGVSAARGRTDPGLAVRLLRAYRESGRFDRAREYAASLPAMPPWAPLEAARLSIERAILAAIEGRLEHAEAELLVAARTLSGVPKSMGIREQLDLCIAQAQVETQLGREETALEALQSAERLVERVEDGRFRASVSTSMGHLAMRLALPGLAARSFAVAESLAPPRQAISLEARGNLAIALATLGRVDDGRPHAIGAISAAIEQATDWRLADAYDALAIVELLADRPTEGLRALDEADLALGDVEYPTIRYALAQRRAVALAVLGHADSADQSLARARRIHGELASVDPLDEIELGWIRARVLEARDEPAAAVAEGLRHVASHPAAFVVGALNVLVGRCALVAGDEATARAAVERAALSGDAHGWVFPERQASQALWRAALSSGDSRVVRYAERMVSIPESAPVEARASVSLPAVTAPPLVVSRPPTPASTTPNGDGVVYVTTAQGVARVALADLPEATRDAKLVVDTLAHALRIDGREISLERRRALEPLVVQLLRRAREGLSADDVLRAAGGPGRDSADAEHRVRVLISRVRDLVGGAATIERVRDAGERGRTRYRLSATLPFALIEPLTGSIPP